MQEYQDLIVEIGTEELPPMVLSKMSEMFAKQLQQEFKSQDISCGVLKIFATPRRIAVFVKNLAIKKKTKHLENQQSLPNKNTKETTIDLLPSLITRSVNNLPPPKMHWGCKDYIFARPVHWILVVFGSHVVPFSLFALKSSNLTFGHRFLSNNAIMIKTPAEYEELLLTKGKVIADPSKRKQTIVELLKQQAAALNAELIHDASLLEQVTNMVEYPGVLCGIFDEKFLQLPNECLQAVMKDHQKCFAVTDQNKKLLPKFLLITNMPIENNHTIIKGNEKVMQARLQDAMFLYNQDLRTPVEQRLEQLKNVILEEKLGNLYDQSIRISVIAEKICQMLKVADFDLVVAKKAALLCKTDLVSHMVLEFPELQGIMGSHYVEEIAKKHKIDDFDFQVARAIKEHYLPKFSNDQLPNQVAAIAVAIAYRLSLLGGMFMIGSVPTGDQDPFALRRHAIAIIRMLIEKCLPLNIRVLLEISLETYNCTQKPKVLEQLMDFCTDRLKFWYTVTKKQKSTLFNACFSKFAGWVYDFELLLTSLNSFSKTKDYPKLISINKRITNILHKNSGCFEENGLPDPTLFISLEEKALFSEINRIESIVLPLIEEQKYELAFNQLADVQSFVDNFFDKVMVLVSDVALRRNRLLLLQQIKKLLFQIADFSVL